MGVFATYLFSILNSRETECLPQMPESLTGYFMSYTWLEDVAINLLFVILVDVLKVSAM